MTLHKQTNRREGESCHAGRGRRAVSLRPRSRALPSPCLVRTQCYQAHLFWLYGLLHLSRLTVSGHLATLGAEEHGKSEIFRQLSAATRCRHIATSKGGARMPTTVPVIDDDPDIRDMLNVLLHGEAGYALIAAADPASALDRTGL